MVRHKEPIRHRICMGVTECLWEGMDLGVSDVERLILRGIRLTQLYVDSGGILHIHSGIVTKTSEV